MVKFELLELKIVIFSVKMFPFGGKCHLYQMRDLWTDLCLNWGPCEWQKRREKGALRAAHPRNPFSGEYPPKQTKYLPSKTTISWLTPARTKLAFVWQPVTVLFESKPLKGKIKNKINLNQIADTDSLIGNVHYFMLSFQYCMWQFQFKTPRQLQQYKRK